ncbi:uncharacterized protein si:dkey-261h17.1 [Micropterus dolomieu]|uniref:uncharacterized protein si:dkey-261h17.1 n=1 Tax=Micropterus dolomieu TaxID=147949 RepID=UPI001E8EAFD2|nr:uncharacterized protein si:dkey-261h17.1 [Micropterus dolomieu]
MPAPMWRMNGLWRRMAGVLVLSALLLSNEVMCQDNATTKESSVSTIGSLAPSTTASSDVSVTPAVAESSATSGGSPATNVPSTVSPDKQDGGASENTTILKAKDSHAELGNPPPPGGSSVFVGILVSGLIAALAIILGYLKCKRKSDTKGVRLAEEAYPVDQENQGNTLVSVAPLNPPPETQEKPSINGESPEADKTQPPPPTNGHSTTKTADTEL